MVYSNLGGGGGGVNSHLDLVFISPQYDLIAPNTPYNRPVFPGNSIIPTGTTNVQTQLIHEAHGKKLREFHKTEALHNALVQQYIKAIETMYLKALQNPVTPVFTLSLCKIESQNI